MAKPIVFELNKAELKELYTVLGASLRQNQTNQNLFERVERLMQSDK